MKRLTLVLACFLGVFLIANEISAEVYYDGVCLFNSQKTQELCATVKDVNKCIKSSEEYDALTCCWISEKDRTKDCKKLFKNWPAKLKGKPPATDVVTIY